jgi:molecular chaperone DnaJ
MLGGRIRIPTVDGDVDLKVPIGAQPGDNIALRGRGVQRLGGTSRGDQIVTLKVELPRSLKGQQREIIEQYASLVDEEYRPKDEPKVVKQDPTSETKPETKSDTESSEKKDGFFKSTFGKFKGKICHEDEKTNEASDKKSDEKKDEKKTNEKDDKKDDKQN